MQKNSELLTNQRFELGYTEVKEKLDKLKSDGLIDEKQFEKIREEDILLKIKYRTYKKYIRNIIIGLLITTIGIILMLIGRYPLRFLFIVVGIILLINSFFGILFNRITKSQKEYLKR